MVERVDDCAVPSTRRATGHAHPKVLRIWQAGLFPPRLARTKGNPIAGFLAGSRNPHGFLAKGDVMILRPRLVAWPLGSEWRTRRPSRVTHQTQGASQ